MAIYNDGKHTSDNEVNLEQVGGKMVNTGTIEEINLDRVKIKLRVGKTGSLVASGEIIEGFEREDHCGSFSIEGDDSARYNIALDAIESLILAHACEGIDVTSEAYQSGVQTTLDSLSNLP